jgi:hypothetical protein
LAHGEVHGKHVDPDKKYPLKHDRQVVNVVLQVSQGEVHVHVYPESTFPEIQVKQVVAAV